MDRGFDLPQPVVYACPMDISSLGPVFYLLFALPGFIGVWSLRVFFRARRSLGGWEWPCWSAIYGILIFAAWEWVMKNNVEQITKFVTNPLTATIVLCVFAFGISVILRIAVAILKLLLKGLVAAIVFVISTIGDAIEDRRLLKKIEKEHPFEKE